MCRNVSLYQTHYIIFRFIQFQNSDLPAKVQKISLNSKCFLYFLRNNTAFSLYQADYQVEN